MRSPALALRSGTVLVCLLFFVGLLNYIDRSLLVILQEPVKRELGLSDTELGLLTGTSFALLYSMVAVGVAQVADRYSRSRVLAVALFLWSAATALTGLAAGFAMLVLLRLCVASGEAGYGPASHALICDRFAPARRTSILGIMAFAVPLGTMAGFLSGGWIGEILGWRASFVIIGSIGILTAPLVWFLPEASRTTTREEAAPEGRPASAVTGTRAIAQVWHRKAFRLLAFATAFQAYALYSFQNWSASFYVRVHDWPQSRTSVAMALMFGLGGGVGTLLGGFLADRLSRRDLVWFGGVPALASVAALPLLLTQFALDDPSVSALVGIGTVCALTAFVAPTNAAAQYGARSDQRALTSAMLLVIPTVSGLGLGPLVTGMVSDHLSTVLGAAAALRIAISTSAIALPLAALLYWRAGRAVRAEALAATRTEA